jgi:hypothetical protein
MALHVRACLLFVEIRHDRDEGEDRLQSHDGRGAGRDGPMTDVDELVQVIRDVHGVEATHVRSEPVRETAQDAVRISIAAEARRKAP